MFKIYKSLILILLFTLLLSFSVNADGVTTINDLIENAKQLDGQTVIVQGEAIGDRMNRGDYSWVNINDGTNAIGIWIKNDQADKITYYGNYKHTGDKLRITGTFYRACPEHGGEADLHVQNLGIIEKGHKVEEHVSFIKVILTCILATIAIVLFLHFNRRHNSFI